MYEKLWNVPSESIHFSAGISDCGGLECSHMSPGGGCANKSLLWKKKMQFPAAKQISQMKHKSTVEVELHLYLHKSKISRPAIITVQRGSSLHINQSQ